MYGFSPTPRVVTTKVIITIITFICHLLRIDIPKYAASFVEHITLVLDKCHVISCKTSYA